jgi:hypothetical protein
MTGWQPISVREGRGTPDQTAGPHEGVPDWMFGPLWQWLTERFPVRIESWPNRDALVGYRAVASALRISLESADDPNPGDASGLRDRLHDLAEETPSILLDACDYWLAVTDVADVWTTAAVRELDSLLATGGSAYRVAVGEHLYLGRRVAQDLDETVSRLSTSGRAGDHLRLARRAIFKRDPDASAGYRESIKAVEAAAIPIVSPTNARATLGTVIAELRGRPDQWTVELASSGPDGPVGIIRGMLELLWQGQIDRHGTPDETAPLSVNQGQAEAAFHLALTLVQFFTAGVIRPVE